jgi:stage II sporulation protein P
MVVVGTDAAGNHHPGWQQNLSLGLKLTALLEQTDPGLTRPVNLRSQRFNMDLTAGSLLIEVGAAGNSHDEAVLAAGALARAILVLARGSR